MILRHCLCLLLLATLVRCETTAPTADQMDLLESKVRADHAPQYADLNQQRASGQLTPDEYVTAKAALDLRVRNKVDTMLWNRHALAESDRKANGLPTPDKPVANLPPGVGQTQGSLYTSSRLNGMGNQVQGNFMRDMGSTNFNERRAGTAYDGQ